jgi:hypothetical protein
MGEEQKQNRGGSQIEEPVVVRGEKVESAL